MKLIDFQHKLILLQQQTRLKKRSYPFEYSINFLLSYFTMAFLYIQLDSFSGNKSLGYR